MDGIINVRVNGYSIVKDHNCAGAQFEENSTKLRIEFSKDWDGFAKTVTFWNALGESPVEVTLTTNLLENITQSTGVYLVPIPGEAMDEVGMAPFAIDGYADGVRKRTVEEKLKVLSSRKEDNAGEPQDPTPTQAEQLQKQIDEIIDTVAEVAKSAEKVKESEMSAAEAAESAAESETNALKNAESAAHSANDAKNYIEIANAAVAKTSYIGENGNWYEWDGSLSSFVDTGIKAQSGSTVYVGTNPPEEADVWIDTGAEYEGVYATKEEVKEQIEALHTEVDLKADQENIYTKTEVDGKTQAVANNFLDAMEANTDYLDTIKADKTTVAETLPGNIFEFSATDNQEVRLAEASSISFTFGNGEYSATYTSGLSFDSGATPTSIDYTDSGILNWVGTDCTTVDGLSIFQPSANTHYDIVFYFNGIQFIGLVNGYVPSVSR